MGEGEIVQRQEGFTWEYSEERTVRVAGNDPKFADTITRKGKMSGNAVTFEAAQGAFEIGKSKVLESVNK